MWVGIALSVLALLLCTPAVNAHGEGEEPNTSEILVTLINESTKDNLMDIIKDIQTLKLVKPLSKTEYLLRVNERGLIDCETCDKDEDVMALKKDPRVKDVKPVAEYKLKSTGELDLMWSINDEPALTPSMYVRDAWNMTTGQGVQIGFVELSWLDQNHSDLVNQIISTHDVYYDSSFNESPTVPGKDKLHGTAVAGLTIGEKGNDVCYAGVAFGAKGHGISIQTRTSTVSQFLCADGNSYKRDDISIYNNAFGQSDCRFFLPFKACEDAIEEGAQLGRNGLGNIFVFPADNLGPGCNPTTLSLRNSIYTIITNSPNIHQEPASYAGVGASILTVAYGGDNDNPMHLLAPGDKCDFTDRGNSYSIATLSGIISLVLAKRPDLTWRDIQHMLVCTSKKSGLTASDYDWQTNGGSFQTHPIFGYGLVNAVDMVMTAMKWTNVQQMITCYGINQPNLSVTQAFATDTIDISCKCHHCRIRYLENIRVTVLFSWIGRRGDIEIYLISPIGTKSYLLHRRPIDNMQSSIFGSNRMEWTFKTVQSWGESPCGRWTLRFGSSANVQVTVHRWSMDLYGLKKKAVRPLTSCCINHANYKPQ